eukprot:2322013-Lingulodinium_polyedra.AAC.1
MPGLPSDQMSQLRPPKRTTRAATQPEDHNASPYGEQQIGSNPSTNPMLSQTERPRPAHASDRAP